MDRRELYVSTDIETDGFVPVQNSMLSIGSAAFTADKKLIATYSANLETLPEARAHPQTERWWRQFPEAWEKCRENARPPQVVMPEYAAWLRSLPGRVVFVGYPASFDFMFVAWYLLHFAEDNPFGFAALDIKSYAMAVLECPFGETVKERMPSEWFDDLSHTHVALDDAIEQGHLFCNLLMAARGSRRRE